MRAPHTFRPTDPTPSRRQLLTALALLPWVLRAGAADDAAPLQLVWRVPAEAVPTATQALGFQPDQVSADLSTTDQTRGLPLLYVLAGLVLLPDLANGLVGVYRNFKGGRTIIQCQGKGKCSVDHDPDGPDDTVVITASSGVVVQSYQNRRSFDSSKWIELLSKAFSAVPLK